MNNMLNRIKERTLYKTMGSITTFYNKCLFRLNGYRYGKHFRCNGRIIIRGRTGKVFLGDDVIINSASWANPIGAGNCTEIKLLGGTLQIGNGVGLSNVGFGVQQDVIIEDNVVIGGGCRIYDTDFHAFNSSDRLHDRGTSESIRICKGAFIGAGVTILKGSKIGENTIIGAGSVIAGKAIGDNEVWAGNPAKYIKKLEQKQERDYGDQRTEE